MHSALIGHNFNYMNAKLKSWLISLLKVAFSAGIIFWLVNSGRFEFRQLGVLLQWQHFLVIMTILFLNWLISSERWRLILVTQGFQTKPLQAMRLTLIGAFFNYVIPGGVGGDVVKSFYVAKENPAARLKSVITIAMDRLLGLFSMVALALVVMCWDLEKVLSQKELSYIFTGILIIFCGFLVAWSFVFSRRLFNSGFIQNICQKLPHGDKPLKLYQAFSEYRTHKAAFFKAVFYSLAAQGVAILSFVYIGWALGYHIDFHTYFFVVPIGFMITAIPISPAGVGVGQAGYYFLFNLATGTTSQMGPLLISANQIFNFLFGLIGALIYVADKGKKPNLTADEVTQP